MVQDGPFAVSGNTFSFLKLIATIFNRTLRKRLNKSKDIEGPTNGECIQELKSILREKEMFITDLRIESKLTSHRIEEMANALRKGEEETLAIKRNNDYLEKAIKSKVLD